MVDILDVCGKSSLSSPSVKPMQISLAALTTAVLWFTVIY